MKWESLQALRALRDDPRAPRGERDAAAEMLRRRLAAAGIDEEALDKPERKIHSFIVARGAGRKLFTLVGCCVLDQNPLNVETIIPGAAGLETWKLDVTVPEAIDLHDCYAHYLKILSASQDECRDARAKVTSDFRAAIRNVEKRVKELREEIALREKNLLNALAHRFELFPPKNPKRKPAAPMSDKEKSATIAAMNDMSGEKWARKLGGDPQGALGNGQLQLGFDS